MISFEFIQGVIEKEGVDGLANLIKMELLRAKKKYPRKFASGHEGYGVLLEEVDELWDDVKADDLPHSVAEALHVAAMALQYMIEVTELVQQRASQ